MKPRNFRGLQIEREDNSSLFIHQTKYIEKIIKQYLEKEEINGTNIPMDPGLLNTFEEKGDEDKEGIPYRDAIGSIMYATIVSRPDITCGY